LSIYRRAQRRDENEPEIVAALERVGAEVERMSQPCDLLVWFRRDHFPIEIDGVKKYRKRSQKQLETLERMGIPRVKNPEEALRAIGAMS